MLRPRNDYVLVLIEHKEKETKQGTIILPDADKEVTYTVAKTGSNITDLKSGDKVLLKQYHEEFAVGKDLFLIKESDIIGVENE